LEERGEAGKKARKRKIMEAVEDKGIARLVPKGVRFICPL